MDEVKYKKGDIVLFRYGQKIKNGTIVIVDGQRSSNRKSHITILR